MQLLLIHSDYIEYETKKNKLQLLKKNRRVLEVGKT